MYSLFGRYISFSLFIPITLEIMHSYIHTQYQCLLHVMRQTQMFSFGSHISSFTSIITYVFLFERHIPMNYILYACMQGYMYVCIHAGMYVSMHTHVFMMADMYDTVFCIYICACIDTYIQRLLYVGGQHNIM